MIRRYYSIRTFDTISLGHEEAIDFTELSARNDAAIASGGDSPVLAFRMCPHLWRNLIPMKEGMEPTVFTVRTLSSREVEAVRDAAQLQIADWANPTSKFLLRDFTNRFAFKAGCLAIKNLDGEDFGPDSKDWEGIVLDVDSDVREEIGSAILSLSSSRDDLSVPDDGTVVIMGKSFSPPSSKTPVSSDASVTTAKAVKPTKSLKPSVAAASPRNLKTPPKKK